MGVGFPSPCHGGKRAGGSAGREGARVYWFITTDAASDGQPAQEVRNAEVLGRDGEVLVKQNPATGEYERTSIGSIAPTTIVGGNQKLNGQWFDAEGFSIPVPPSVGAADRVPKVLQSGGNTISSDMASSLNEYFGENLTRREWGALEALKNDSAKFHKNFHDRILDNGNYVEKNGEIIGNIGFYLR